MQLIEINPMDVQRVFPSFYHADSQFFMITHKTCEVGIYGIKTIDEKVCEISLCIFEEYRFKLPYRTGLKLLLNFPFTHTFVYIKLTWQSFTYKFDKILISTQEKSMITLLRQCQNLGVEFIGYDSHNCKKVWFKRERP